MSTIDTVIDVLHAAGAPGFVYDPTTDAPIATIHAGDLGGGEIWWASCKPCWWWDEDEPDFRRAGSPAEAQARADAHNRIHHQEAPSCG